jgi:hypothetical protein
MTRLSAAMPVSAKLRNKAGLQPIIGETGYIGPVDIPVASDVGCRVAAGFVNADIVNPIINRRRTAIAVDIERYDHITIRCLEYAVGEAAAW